MAATLVTRKPDRSKSRPKEGRPDRQGSSADRRPATAATHSAELLNRKALSERLEAQRLDLLRAMSCVSRAQRTIEEHVGAPTAGAGAPIAERQQEPYCQHVLDALHDAAEALRTAYPMLERIAQALAVEEILEAPTARPSSPRG